jgi:anthranilate phosphoribosyltransferase
MIKKIIKDLTCFKDLKEGTAYDVMRYIIKGNATDAQIASFLTALKHEDRDSLRDSRLLHGDD